MSTPRVLISILNWNKASDTLECLRSLRHQIRDGFHVDILVIDNGSTQADYAMLRDAVDTGWVTVKRVEKNLGFTGGHNLSLQMAIDQDYDFVWLLNNDATVAPDTLAKLVNTICADERCGAVSPVLYPEAGTAQEHGWGITHDWRSRSHDWVPSAAASKQLHETDPDTVCLTGTAILLRVQALREIGLLDERLFAYYDDNDIGTRLVRGGWRNKVVFDAGAVHALRTLAEQPPYFFYLMFRNELIFWHTHMPAEHRKLLWPKLINQSLYHINRLRLRGYPRQAESALLGVWDFVCGKTGEPKLGRRPPLLMRIGCKLLGRLHNRQLRETETRNNATA
jgi:GT2 family glycosyltransferase